MLTLILLSILPRETTLVDACETVELQHYFDEEARHVFDQLIFYAPDEEIRAWRIVREPSQLPRRDWQHGGYVTTWLDNETPREVRSKWFRETWEQYDRELVARQTLPAEKRRELKQASRVAGKVE